MTPVSRRSFMAGMAALPAMRATRALSALPVNPGIIVIGGGVAGMAAANTLIDNGYPALILEAKGHLGGRTYTEKETFGMPYDHGASILHSADLNPLTDLVRANRFDVVNLSESETWLYMDGKEATAEQYEALGQSLEDVAYKMDYGNEYYDKYGKDVSLRILHPPSSRSDIIAHATIGPLVNGMETSRVSLYDVFQQTSTGIEWGVPEGLGAAVNKALGDVPVSLKTPVRKVNWYNSDLIVETDLGNISTKAVIVTVPPVLIAEKKLQFDPPLPPWKWGAVRSLPMGNLDKVAIAFKPGYLDAIPENTMCLIHNGERGPVWEFVVRPYGRNMAIGHIGGKGANILRSQKEDAAIRAAVGALMSAFGTGIKDAAIKGHYTNWGNDEWTRGAFSSQKVGAILSREEMAKPLHQRLFFAGEATSIEWSGSVAGAYSSGVRAANEVLRWVKI